MVCFTVRVFISTYSRLSHTAVWEQASTGGAGFIQHRFIKNSLYVGDRQGQSFRYYSTQNIVNSTNTDIKDKEVQNMFDLDKDSSDTGNLYNYIDSPVLACAEGAFKY